jgi:tetratricopeptide (TPR) repeat protein
MPVKSTARKKMTREQSRDLDVKIQFMEGLVRRDQSFTDALLILGDHYTQRGRFEEGLRVDEKLARLEPRNPLVFYNLACSYSLTDQIERAIHALEKAFTFGYCDFKWLSKDPDLRKLRKDPRFRRIRDRIKQLKASAT